MKFRQSFCLRFRVFLELAVLFHSPLTEYDEAEFLVLAPLGEYSSFLRKILGIYQVESRPKKAISVGNLSFAYKRVATETCVHIF